MKRMIDALITFILAVVLWQLVVWLSDVPHFILPGPVSVWNAFLFNFELIIEHAQITIAEVLIGTCYWFSSWHGDSLALNDIGHNPAVYITCNGV